MSSRVAVITDVHANVPALEAALRRIEELGVDELYCGGDLVGYGPRPNGICREVEERAIPTIYGNYDYAIARNLDDCGCFYPTPKDREIGQGSVAWTLEHTDERSKRFMHDLPFDLRFELAGKRVRLVHGSPRKVNEYLLEDRPASSFERIAQLADCDILLFGHTHRPWVREYGNVLFVNCGFDRHYGHLARDGREHAIRLLDELSAGQRPRWTLVDAAWTPRSEAAATQDNGTDG